MKKIDKIIKNWLNEEMTTSSSSTTTFGSNASTKPNPQQQDLLKIIKTIESGKFRNDPQLAATIIMKLLKNTQSETVNEYTPDEPEKDLSKSENPREKFVKRYRAQGPSKNQENPQRYPQARNYELDTDE